MFLFNCTCCPFNSDNTVLLCYLAARESSKGAGVGLSTQKGIQPFVQTVICLSAYCYCCLYLGFYATFVSASMKEKTVRETEIQTQIQRKVRIFNAVCHGTHFKRIHVVICSKMYLYFYLFCSSRTSREEKQKRKQSKRR